MNGLTTTIYRKSSELPQLEDSNFFHSRRLMEISEQTPHQRPYMVVVSDSSNRVLSHLLAIQHIRPMWLPPFILVHCRVLGEGIYTQSDYPADQLFGEMITKLNQTINNFALYIEVSNLSQKMFGYRQLRQQGFFPVNWMSIHNSLHSHAPEERITPRLQKRIDTAHQRGVTTVAVSNEEDFKAFSKLLHRHNIFKPKRYIPDDVFFRSIMEQGDGQLFVTKYRDHVIGCSACVYSNGNAYLWYMAFRRKTFMHLHPDILTVWDAMKDAYDKGFQHMCFMDVGLPFSKNPFRDFILRFGGKEQSTYRWFRLSIGWANRLFAWIYRG